MFTSLYLKLGGLALVLAALAGLWIAGDVHGHKVMSAKDAAVRHSLEAQMDDAREQITVDATTLQQMKDAAALAETAAANQKAVADAAVAALKQATAQQAKDAAAWQARLKAAEKSQGCKAQLEAQLCPAISDY